MTQRERQLLNWIEENPLISQQELADKAGITRQGLHHPHGPLRHRGGRREYGHRRLAR